MLSRILSLTFAAAWIAAAIPARAYDPAAYADENGPARTAKDLEPGHGTAHGCECGCDAMQPSPPRGPEARRERSTPASGDGSSG